MLLKVRNFLNRKVVLIVGLIICLYQLGHLADKYFGYTNGTYESKKLSPILADGTGYYFYLTKIYVYRQDSAYMNVINEKYTPYSYHTMLGYDKEKPNFYSKFFSGTAILQTPFFLINHGMQKLSDSNTDGYSFSYSLTITLCSLFYWLLGILFFIKILKFFQIENFLILFAIVMITFATNLCYYTSIAASYSHVYSFFAISAFLYYALLLGKTRDKKYLLLFSLFLGLILIIRPVNVLVVFILPFCFPTLKEFWIYLKDLFSTQKKILFFSILTFALIVALHFIYFYLANKTLKFNGYQNEGFTNILSPEFLNVFFSFRKGLFIYAPFLLLFFPAIIFFTIKKRLFGFGVIMSLFICSWFICAWWFWSYGGGLGARSYVEFLPLFVLPIVYMLQNVKWYAQIIIVSFSFLSLYLYTMFEYQFKLSIIHYDEMNYNHFKQVFLQTDNRFRWYVDNEREINLDGFTKTQTYNYNSKSKIWLVQNQNSLINKFPIAFIDNMISQKDERIIYKLSGEGKIMDGATNVSLDLQIWYNDSVVKRWGNMVGHQISKTNEFQKFERFLEFDLNGLSANEIRIIFPGDKRNEELRNLSITKYVKKH